MDAEREAGSDAEPDAGLDAVLDGKAVAICRQLAGTAFPWDITRSLELALLKTFCLPSISGLLSRTGEFQQRPRKRYDDTGLMVAELLRHGPDSPAGATVISRMNRIHGAYAICNEDFLYVLSTFVAEPIRWLERYGWRPPSRPSSRRCSASGAMWAGAWGSAPFPPAWRACWPSTSGWSGSSSALQRATGS